MTTSYDTPFGQRSDGQCFVCGKPLKKKWTDRLPAGVALAFSPKLRQLTGHLLKCRDCTFSIAKGEGRPCTEGTAMMVGFCRTATHA